MKVGHQQGFLLVKHGRAEYTKHLIGPWRMLHQAKCASSKSL